MEAWIDELAAELGEDPLTKEEVVRLLEIARDVAHRVERKTTPLATFLIGTAVGRAEAGGLARDRVLDDVFSTLGRLLPERSPGAEQAPAATPEETSEARGEGVPAEGAEEGDTDGRGDAHRSGA